MTFEGKFILAVVAMFAVGGMTLAAFIDHRECTQEIYGACYSQTGEHEVCKANAQDICR